MTKELISLHVGQCGCQTGAAYLQHLSTEHELGGRTWTHNPTPCFRESNNKELKARSLFVDSEPRVAMALRESPLGRLIEKHNFFVFPSASGAGNNWAEGYALGNTSAAERITELLERELEQADSPGALLLFHSVSGGTGSGLGSFLLEKVADSFPKLPLVSASVLPSNRTAASDVVVQPYNAVLALQRVTACVDAALCFDNSMFIEEQVNALEPASELLQGFQNANAHIAAAAATLSSGSRLVGNGVWTARAPSLEAVLLGLVAGSRNNLLATSTATGNSSGSLVRKLFRSRNFGLDLDFSQGRFVAATANVKGNEESPEVLPASFVPWAPASFRVGTLSEAAAVDSLMYANHTGVRKPLARILADFAKLKRRDAFVDRYKRASDALDVDSIMQSAFSEVTELVQEYTAMESTTYLD